MTQHTSVSTCSCVAPISLGVHDRSLIPARTGLQGVGRSVHLVYWQLCASVIGVPVPTAVNQPASTHSAESVCSDGSRPPSRCNSVSQ